MTKSAGILAYRFKKSGLEVFLVHPGGIFWKNKDTGAWSIPKGEFNDEDSLKAAKREFQEETGEKITGKFQELSPIVQKNKKVVYAWAVEANFDPSNMKSNLFEIEWPPHSGRMQSFPEVDKFAWFDLEEARIKIIPAQYAFIEQLQELLNPKF